MITISIMMATIMQTLDSTIANVALPHMQGTFSAAQDQIAWVLTAYIVAAAIATPLTGWLVARFGQKQLLLASVIGFTVASVLCGVSNSLAEIVTARLLQGVFGASLVPLSQVVIMDINPPEKQGSALSIWGVGVWVGPIIGPTLGGWLTDSYDWRWVFFINVPIGALAAWGIWKYIHRTEPVSATRFDVFGFATLTLSIGSLQLLLDRGEQNDWFSSTETWIEVVLLVVSLTYFIAHTALTRAERSFFDHRLLNNQNYVSGLIFIFVMGMILYATRAIIPTMLETLLDYPVATAGLVTAPAGMGTMLALLVVGRIIGRVDTRLILLIGLGITAFSFWQMTNYSLDLSEGDIVWPGVVQGIGSGLTFGPLSVVAFATLTPALRAQGTAIFSLMRNIGSSIGISLVQTELVRGTIVSHAALAERINHTNVAFANPAVSAAYALNRPSGIAALDAAINQQAAMIAYIDDFRLVLFLTLALTPLLLFMHVPRQVIATAETHPVIE